MTIEWKSLNEEYNDRHGTDYTEKQMWESLYPEHTCFELETMFMVAPNTILERIGHLGIKIEPRGHRHPTRLDKFRAIPNHKLMDMADDEIAAEIGSCVSTVAHYRSRYGR